MKTWTLMMRLEIVKDTGTTRSVAAEKAGIPLIYSQRFSHVVSEDDKSIIFAFADGSQQMADILIGADGIHSSVRHYLWPDVQPTWSNMVAISCVAPATAVQVPFDSYRTTMSVSIHGPAGAVHIAPKDHDGSELFVAINWPTHERTREGWDDRDIMISKDLSNAIVQSAINAAPLETFFIWPFYTVPKLDRWCSEQGKVIILGDAAHAIPPTGGQGLNQGLEDVLSLSLILKAIRDKTLDLKSNLSWWQYMRQRRVNRVIGLAGEISARRRPGWTGEKSEKIDASWLFVVDNFQIVGDWIERQEDIIGKRASNQR
ncbi:Salicylate hydroxylase [Penicillium lagena]|uniref:Salicylate hydroxylase n=1 Tax=Penicillium lagena TaxID=94218 RepID=UPI002540505F|nr:Salicylate hydroxylase [Penicillium lagena]KAJ5621135.1 Salicylate hydroxylase [Penicillium lagena]